MEKLINIENMGSWRFKEGAFVYIGGKGIF